MISFSPTQQLLFDALKPGKRMLSRTLADVVWPSGERMPPDPQSSIRGHIRAICRKLPAIAPRLTLESTRQGYRLCPTELAGIPEAVRSEAGVSVIPLTRGYEAIIDDDDVSLVSPYRWVANVTGAQIYAVHYFWEGDVYRVLFMHRLILGSAAGPVVDHINHNGLDNRRCNIRPATHSQNRANNRSRKAASGFVGVRRQRSKWVGSIMHNGVTYRTARFLSAEEAARARDLLATELFGAFANLNFPISRPLQCFPQQIGEVL